MEKTITDVYELSCFYDARNSFYGKAIVLIEKNGTKTLLSYSTEVAYIKNDEAVVKGTYSPTTLRHIKEFLKQNGFEATCKAQIEKDYM